jgi:hypothetical protein
MLLDMCQGIEENSMFATLWEDILSLINNASLFSLFVRFVEVLGAEAFLGPVCSLMVDKIALKLVKLRDLSLISLPLALLQHFDGLTQLRVGSRLSCRPMHLRY